MPSEPLRITHYLPAVRLADGGVARTVLDWCAVLAQRGNHVTLLCHDPMDIPAAWQASATPGIPRTIVTPAVPPLPWAGSRVENQVLAETDILHLHAPWELANLRLARNVRRLQVPYILSVHGMLDDWSMSQRNLKKRVYLALAGKRLLDRAATVHCTAEAELAQARKWFSNPHTAVLPLLVDLSAFANLPGQQPALELVPESMRPRRKILFLSRLHEKKGVDVLIRASRILRDMGIDAVTLIAGTGEPECVKHLKDLVNELNLSDRIVFLGMITGTNKTSLYQAADLLALPTQQENFGLVLAEAMACGTPVITTRGTDIWTEIQSAGAVIIQRTPEAFATGIAQLLSNETERVERGQRGKAWVHCNLATDSLALKYEALYRTCRPATKSFV